MNVRVGDRIALETEHVGGVEREGEVLEVIERSVGASYRVKWHDGHESIFMPAAGSIRVLGGRAPRRKSGRPKTTSAR